MGKRVFFTLDLYYNYDDKSLYMNYELLKNLKPKESSILEYLILNSNIKCSYKLIYESNWGDLFLDSKPVTDALKGIRDFSNIKSSMIYKNDLHKLFKEDVIKTCRGEGLIIYKNRIKEVKDLSQKDDEPSDDDTPNTNKTTSLNDKYTDEQIIHEYSDEESLFSGPNPIDNYPIYPSSMILYEDFKQYETYYERVEPLEKIETIMNSYSDQHRIVIIGGMGGMGKTELAKAYAYNHFELNSEHLNIDKAYSNEFFIVYNNDVDELTKEISSKLKTCIPEKTLLIVDNLNTGIENGFESIVNSVLSVSLGTDIIITTRNVVVSRNFSPSFINITDYTSVNDCLSIFKNIYELENDFRNTFTLSNDEKELLSEIFIIVGANVLFAKLLAIQARENNGLISIKAYYDIIKRSISNIKQAFSIGVPLDNDEFEHNYPDSVNPYLIIKEIILDNYMTRIPLSYNDIKALLLLSLCSPINMEQDLLCDYTGLNNIDFKSIHNKLVKQGLINFQISDKSQSYLYNIHPLLAQLFIDNLNEITNSEEFNSIIVSLLKGLLSLNYAELERQRYIFFYLLNKCTDTTIRDRASVVFDIVYNRIDATDPISLLGTNINNTIPFKMYLFVFEH